MEPPPGRPRGRGAGSNPANRFTRLEVEPDQQRERVETVFLCDTSRTVISTNTSPDIPYEASLNPYRGCEHGCAYCYARPFHEYLGFSAGLDFETRILVKEEAPELLRREISAPGYRPRPLDLSGVTDPYQPVERRLGLTRRCLEVLAEARHPVLIVTKNAMVTRDTGLLAQLARYGAVRVTLSLTTLDAELARRLEPRTSSPRQRLEAVLAFREAGIPCSVLIAPVIPGLTDHEIPALVEAAAGAGAVSVHWLPLRLPGAVEQIFTAWLADNVPLRKERVLARLRAIRHGRLNDPRFGHRFAADGPHGEVMASMFTTACRRHGIGREAPPLSSAAFRPPGGRQLDLFQR
ncbi:MAG: PA0069 family radical SAM protein [Acidobacteria bacterium]|nr:PA0069 family radical SAM protein [Acidobacteriota bacterium]